MKVVFKILIFLSLFVNSISMWSQNLIIKSDTIPIGSDTTAILILPEYRGQMFWEVSYDKKYWVTSIYSNRDSLLISLNNNAWYRAKIIDSMCDSIYSDTIKVNDLNTSQIDSFWLYNPITNLGISGEITSVIFGNDTITCKKIENNYVYQGDIMLSENQIQHLSKTKGNSIPINHPRFKLWPFGVIYYSIDENLKNDYRIKLAIEYWQNNTIIKFIEVKETNEINYVKFVKVDDVWEARADFGMQGNEQKIYLGDNVDTYYIRHELGHTVGLLHEQSRKDRDNYILVNYENIKEEAKDNFDIKSYSFSSGEFDYKSLMLYPCYNGFAINVLKPTMVKRTTGFPWDWLLTKHKNLTKDDIEMVKLLYQNSGTFTDERDGNVYKWVKIGNQTWMAENLRADIFNDGTPIPLVKDFTEWKNLSTPGYCWYNNDPDTYKNTYGALYNFFALKTGKLAPVGWHVATDEDWSALINYLGGEKVAGGKLKETGTTHWRYPNEGATNESGFTALPGGLRHYLSDFGSIGIAGDWWSVTSGSSQAYRGMGYLSQGVYHAGSGNISGQSVRCVKD